MWWVCLYFPNWPIEIFQALESKQQASPEAIVKHQKQKKIISHLNAIALKQAVTIGMDLTTARSLCPELTIHERNISQETHCLLKIAKDWETLTPDISLCDSQSILINMKTCLQLWGGFEKSVEKTLEKASSYPYKTHLIWSHTPLAARYIAYSLKPTGCYPLKTLLSLSIAYMPEDSSIKHLNIWVKRLNKMGIYHFGELINIPRKALLQHFNQDLVYYLDRLLGKKSDPQKIVTFDQTFSTDICLDFPVIQQETLMFAIRKLLSRLQTIMYKKTKSVIEIEVILHSETNGKYLLSLTLAQPESSTTKIQPLILLKLEHLAIESGIIKIDLNVKLWVSQIPSIEDFWGKPNTLSDQHTELLNRLTARLGQNNIQSLKVTMDHRPERAWSHCQPETSYVSIKKEQRTASSSSVKTIESKIPTLHRRPVWLLETPKMLNASDEAPYYQGSLRLIWGPERIESGWWEADSIARDYFIGQHPKGSHYWIFKPIHTGIAGKQHWFLQGIFS